MLLIYVWNSFSRSCTFAISNQNWWKWSSRLSYALDWFSKSTDGCTNTTKWNKHYCVLDSLLNITTCILVGQTRGNTDKAQWFSIFPFSLLLSIFWQYSADIYRDSFQLSIDFYFEPISSACANNKLPANRYIDFVIIRTRWNCCHFHFEIKCLFIKFTIFESSNEHEIGNYFKHFVHSIERIWLDFISKDFHLLGSMNGFCAS